jgi:hypothetical protein
MEYNQADVMKKKFALLVEGTSTSSDRIIVSLVEMIDVALNSSRKDALILLSGITWFSNELFNLDRHHKILKIL